MEIRDLRTQADFAACVALQKETWGTDFSDVVPASILNVSQKVGGVAAGAFEGDELIGFVFGISGVERGGRPAHWSDMLAVRNTHRNHGVGAALKHYQCDKLRAVGISRMYWTFDPLDAKNAHINFNRLGIYAREYVRDMYGASDSPLHRGIGTDRLIAIWDFDQPRPAAAESARVEVPHDIHAINRSDPEAAFEWRMKMRKEFESLLPQHVVCGFVRGEPNYYVLASSENFTT